jgi:uncharacterized LabA/DUF88 family protein
MRTSKQAANNYAFIDSQNLNVGVQKFGWKMDWKRFRQLLQDKYGVSKAYMFIGYVPEFENMYEQLHQAGYAVVLKPTYDMTRPRPEAPEKDANAATLLQEGRVEKRDDKKSEDEEKRPVKGNIDAELVLWAMKEQNKYDKAIIVSGDGDFYCLVEYLDEQGKLYKLLAPNAHYSGLFNRYEKYVDRLDQYKRDLAYHDYKKRPITPKK